MNKLLKKPLVGAVAAGVLTLIGLGASLQDQAGEEDSKYGKYIITDALYRKIDHYTGTSLVSHSGELKANVSMGYHCLAKPISFDKPHSHDFQEILCFIGGNPLDITDFDAIVEYTIGDEKHVITKPACVSMPPGQVHCPISVKNVSVEKPIVFLEISLAPEYGTPKDAK
jgi:hypothetical protein